MNHVMNVDLETFSATDITNGVYRYVEDPEFRILLIGYKVDNGDEHVIDLTDPLQTSYATPGLLEFQTLLLDPDTVKTAYNANFERTCLARWLGRRMPPEQWDDTMIRAAELGLPGTLAAVGEALGLPQDQQKDKEGKALIQYFCKPCKPTKANCGRTRNLPEHAPEKWAKFIEYNRQDVVAESAIRDRLKRYPIAGSEQELWCLDQNMNDDGIRIDTDMVEAIIEESGRYTAELTEEAREITGLDNPNSVAQLKNWLNEGHFTTDPVDKLTKDTLPQIYEEMAGNGAAETDLRVLDIRTEQGKASVKKYQAMQDAVCEDGRLRGLFRFYGANRTGRWSGRIVQPQNLARNSLPDLDLARKLVKARDFETLQMLFGGENQVFSELVRTAFIPSEGCRFVVSDFSAIEARVIAWLAGEQWRMDVFAEGGDIYCASASQMFKVPVVKHGVNGHLRQKGKIAELALGYGGGVGAMKAMDKAGSIPEEELQGIVNKWREASPRICRLWRDYEAAAAAAITEHRSVYRGVRIKADNLAERERIAGRPVRQYSVRDGIGVTFSYVDGILFIKLPSGRRIAYWGARYEPDTMGHDALTYMGVDQTTKQWKRIDTWGGKIVENIVQAVARDCLAETMRRVDQMGYRIVMHVHDEIIVDASKDDTDALERICAVMGEPIDWAPGLLLRGDGYETEYYKKD